jgi:asparagine synthase (glutamine-hydrolysing)
LNQRWPHLLLRPEVAQRLNLYERYRETAAYDAPYRSINEFIIGHHLTRMQLSARLENCTIIAAAYGVDYRWPLWDQRLVQQYLSTPSIEKVGPQGMGRYLHRRAIDGVVPRRVTWKPSKDMGYSVQRAKPREAALRQITTWAGEMEAKLHPALETVIDRTKLRQQIQQLESGKVIESNIPIMQNLNHLHWLNQWFSLEDGS